MLVLHPVHGHASLLVHQLTSDTAADLPIVRVSRRGCVARSVRADSFQADGRNGRWRTRQSVCRVGASLMSVPIIMGALVGRLRPKNASLLHMMLQLNPKARPSCEAASAHAWFHSPLDGVARYVASHLYRFLDVHYYSCCPLMRLIMIVLRSSHDVNQVSFDLMLKATRASHNFETRQQRVA